MRLSSLVARAFRGLKTARVRTLLTALAIAVGGFVLTLTLAASHGTRQFADSIIADSIESDNLIVSRTDLTGSESFTAVQEYDEDAATGEWGMEYLTKQDVEKLQQYDFAESVRVMYTIAPKYITFEKGDQGKDYRANSISSVDPAMKLNLVAGKGEADIKDGDIVVSDSYREALGLDEAKDLLGYRLTVVVDSPRITLDPSAQPLEKTFTVTGVLNSSPLTNEPLGIYINSNDAKELNDFATKGTPLADQFMLANLTVKNGEDEDAMAAAKKQLEDDDFKSMGASDAQEMVGQIIDVLQGIVFGFGAITLIASVFGVVNTMYISVLERTREIGLMKALGMSRRSLRWLFRIEAAWIGLLGGVIGSLAGWGVGSLLNPLITEQLKLEQNLLVFPLSQVLIMIGALIIVAMLAGMLPARKAARLDPVEALRTE